MGLMGEVYLRTTNHELGLGLRLGLGVRLGFGHTHSDLLSASQRSLVM